MTVPGIGAVTVDCSPAPSCDWEAESTLGIGRGGGAGRLSRHAPAHDAAGAAGGGSESGGYSERNAVVARPSRTTGCVLSQRRNGRVVVTPVTVVLRRAAVSASYASPRV